MQRVFFRLGMWGMCGKFGLKSSPNVRESHATRPPVPPSRCGCRSARKGTRAAILQRIASALSGNSGNPLQPEPPHICSRYSDLIGAGGGPGETPFCLNIHLPLSPLANSPLGSRGTRMPPAALRARVDDPSTRESGLPAANQSHLDKIHTSIPLASTVPQKYKQKTSLPPVPVL